MYLHINDENLMPVFAECIDREVLCDFDFPYSFILNGKSLISLLILEKTHRNKIDIIFVDSRCSDDIINHAKNLLAPGGHIYYKERDKDFTYYKKCIVEQNNNEAIVLDIRAVTEKVVKAVIELNESDDGKRKFLLCTNCRGINILYVKTVRLMKRNENASINLKYFDQHLIHIAIERKKFENCFKLYVNELVNLENHCDRFASAITVLDSIDADILLTRDMPKRIKVYLWKNVNLSKEHKQIIEEKNIQIIKIPQYFFKK